MKVVRLARGWRLRATDNEFELLRLLVARGLVELDDSQRDALPYKLRKVLHDPRWATSDGALAPDEARRP